MNVLTLIQQHPLLRADLAHHGVPFKRIDAVAESISMQFGSAADNLSQVFAALTYTECLARLDPHTVAAASGISTGTASAVLDSVATCIDRYEALATHLPHGHMATKTGTLA